MSKNVSLSFFSFLLAISAIFIAFFAMYVMKMQPCKLCVYQQSLYLVIILISGVNGMWLHCIYISYFIIALWFFESCIALYQVGAAHGLWNAGCGADFLNTSMNKEQFALHIKNTLTSCVSNNMKILGWHMASLNAIYSIFANLFLCSVMYRYKNER